MSKMPMDIHSLLGKFEHTERNERLEIIFRLAYVFVIGRGQKSWVSLPSGKGLRLSVAEERDRRLAGKSN